PVTLVSLVTPFRPLLLLARGGHHRPGPRRRFAGRRLGGSVHFGASKRRTLGPGGRGRQPIGRRRQGERSCGRPKPGFATVAASPDPSARLPGIQGRLGVARRGWSAPRGSPERRRRRRGAGSAAVGSAAASGAAGTRTRAGSAALRRRG